MSRQIRFEEVSRYVFGSQVMMERRAGSTCIGYAKFTDQELAALAHCILVDIRDRVPCSLLGPQSEDATNVRNALRELSQREAEDDINSHPVEFNENL